MIKIFSNIEKKELLGIIFRKNDFNKISRKHEIWSKNDYLNINVMKFNELDKFITNDILKIAVTNISINGAWVIIDGSVNAIFFDFNKTKLYNTILYPGDMCVTFKGEHIYEVLKTNTFIYEFKLGQYIHETDDNFYKEEYYEKN